MEGVDAMCNHVMRKCTTSFTTTGGARLRGLEDQLNNIECKRAKQKTSWVSIALFPKIPSLGSLPMSAS